VIFQPTIDLPRASLSPAAKEHLGVRFAPDVKGQKTRAVDELAPLDDRLPAVGSVPNAAVDEPKALAGFDVERFGVVGHGVTY
jgi:hypothetical protein